MSGIWLLPVLASVVLLSVLLAALAALEAAQERLEAERHALLVLVVGARDLARRAGAAPGPR